MVLCVLKRWFSPNYKDIQFVFNAHYASSINEQNPGYQIGRNAILTQLHSMEQQGEDSEAWRSVVLETEFRDPHGHYEKTRLDLEATAAGIGIILVRGWEDKAKVSTRSGRGRISKIRRRKGGSNIEGVLGFAMDDTGEEELNTHPTKRHGLLTPSTSPQDRNRVRQKCGRQAARPFIPPPDDTDDAGVNYRFVPPELAFRFWDDESHGMNTPHGFRAGAFVNYPRNITSPPDRNDQVFRDQTNIHLQPLAKPSSYISVWEGIVPALHRGLRSSKNAHIAFINLHAVYDQQLSGIPGLYPAASAIKQLKMDIKGNYRGVGDWLVWGEIPQRAIVACFTVEDLRRFIHSVPQIVPTLRLNEIEASTCAGEYRQRLCKSQLPISKASGKIVGRFLLFTGLPKPFINFAAGKIARSWRFLGYSNLQRYKAYLDGVHDSFNLQLATTLQIVPNRPPSIKASYEATDPKDTYQIRRAAIQSILAGYKAGPKDPCTQVSRRQVGASTAGKSEAETEIDGFLVRRRRIEAVLYASHAH